MAQKTRAYSVKIGAAIGTATTLVTLQTKNRCPSLTKCFTWPATANVCWIILTTLFASAMVTIAILYFNLLNLRNNPVGICETEECLRFAKSLKESVDTTIDPCEDFYNYTCGKWAQSHPVSCSSSEHWSSGFDFMQDEISKTISRLLEKVPASSAISSPIEQAKVLYTSCMKTDSWEELGLEPLYSLLEQLELPIHDFTNIPNTTSTFLAKLAKVHRTMNLDIFFQVKVNDDEDDEVNKNLRLKAPSLFDSLEGSGIVPRRNKDFNFGDLYKNYSKKHASERRDYHNNTDPDLKFIEDVTGYVLRDLSDRWQHNASLKNLEDLIHETVMTIYSVEKKIGNELSKLTNADRKTTHTWTVKKFENYLVTKAKRLKTTIEPLWSRFVALLFQDLEADFKKEIIFSDIRYLWNMTIILSSTDKKDLTLYLWWVVVKHSIPYLTRHLQKLYYHYRDEVSLKSEKYCRRFIRCGGIVTHLMDKAVASLYIKKYLREPLKIRKELEDMFFHTKAAFNTTVQNISWLDKQTKKAVYDKVGKMSALIGSPLWILNEDNLESYYKGMNISSSSFLTNAVSAVKKKTEHSLLGVVGKNPTEDQEWQCSVLEINAFYLLTFNKITVPFGYIQFPLYGNGLKVLDSAGIGITIGHEIVHGFDSDGISYDGDGQRNSRWTNSSKYSYKKKVQCFIEDYGQFYEPKVNRHVDGRLTINENIADNGEINIAFKAYQAWVEKNGVEPLLPGFTNFTHEQLFFLAHGHGWCEYYTSLGLRNMLNDEHPPSHVRVEMVMRNSEDFSKTWKCPVGSKMNPQKKCHIW